MLCDSLLCTASTYNIVSTFICIGIDFVTESTLCVEIRRLQTFLFWGSSVECVRYRSPAYLVMIAFSAAVPNHEITSRWPEEHRNVGSWCISFNLSKSSTISVTKKNRKEACSWWSPLQPRFGESLLWRASTQKVTG